ncbi:hypothetical protein ACWEVR_28400, partial [Nocardia sp. NPDC003979]
GGKGSGGTPPPTTGGPTGTNTTGQPTGSPAGQGPTGAHGPNTPIGVGNGTGGASGGLSSSDLMSMFSEALQLISSGISTLVQLGNQLAAQLGPGLQALAKAVETGAMTVKEAIDAAGEHIGSELDELREELVPEILPPGATEPSALSLSLFPNGPELRLDLPGRAGGNPSSVIEDFTATRSTTQVPGLPPTTPGTQTEGH